MSRLGNGMGSVSDFIESEEGHERALAAFMQWDYVEGQSKGDGYDFIANDTSKIEAKFDWGSINTGNHLSFLKLLVLEVGNRQVIPFLHNKQISGWSSMKIGCACTGWRS